MQSEVFDKHWNHLTDIHITTLKHHEIVSILLNKFSYEYAVM